MDNNVYIKKGRKYIPFGMRIGEHYLPSGIWYVYQEPDVSGTIDVNYISKLFKVSDTPEYVDIPKLCSMQRYCDHVMNSPEFREIMNNKSFTFTELVHKIIALIIQKNDQIKQKDK